ncbi:hypothetical protein G7Y89_g12113 [Cudoniella acicularis]|uniref:Uncharacterized protein n=1 Tax=Cudoniella acicularis TaxID=354080 RepID=A0A8H4RC68_9HELO|nr:hypothetical protein G7Y89_g12113 [Cudoniella acicularis]
MSEMIGLLSTSDESQLDDSQIEDKESRSRTQRTSRSASFGVWCILPGLLIASLISNLTQAYMWFQLRQAANACKLPLAGLEPNIEVDFGDMTPFGEISDLAALDKLWFSINTGPGIVALPNDRHLAITVCIACFARNCELGTNQTQTLKHVVHCLDVLRSEVMCTADDTPLGFRFQEINQTERAPKRKCRDWNKLVEYATENSACFRRYDPSDPRYDTFEEFMFCPPGSPYNAVIEKLRGQEIK